MKIGEMERKVLDGFGGSRWFSLKKGGKKDILYFACSPRVVVMKMEDLWNMWHIISELR